MRLTNTVSMKLSCVAALAALSLGAIGCDEAPGQVEQPSFVKVRHGDGFRAVTAAAGDAEPSVSERKGSCEPPKSTTQPWEPGNGYFDFDESDPEHTVYYSTCPDHSDNLGIESVSEVEVDPATKELRLYSINTFIPEGVSVSDEYGNPLEVGDRYQIGEACNYVSSYVNCPETVSVLDLGLFLPDIDATVYFEGKTQHYWDYGQDRFRVLYESSQRCEGEDCDDPLVLSIVGEPVECERRGMKVYRRVPPPVFD